MSASGAKAAVAAEIADLLAEYESAQCLSDQLAARSQLEHDREVTRRRKADTRRKIIVGGALLAAYRERPEVFGELVAEVVRRISEPRDRSLVASVLPMAGSEEGNADRLETVPIASAPGETPRRRASHRARGRGSNSAARERHAIEGDDTDENDRPLVPELPAELEADLLSLIESATATWSGKAAAAK